MFNKEVLYCMCICVGTAIDVDGAQPVCLANLDIMIMNMYLLSILMITSVENDTSIQDTTYFKSPQRKDSGTEIV